MSKRQAYGASGLISIALLGLSGCGGGGGGVNSTPAPPISPAPTPTPIPTPAPTPTPSPTATFQTNEYNRAFGLGLANAIPAYLAGATGRGVTAAVIDSGVAASNPEFAGRISAASQDISGSRGVGDDGGHGTAVSAVLLAAKNDSGIHGMAFDATLLSLRTDTPGSCNTNGDCSHSDNAIARALDVAIAQGAKVANLSLGGSGANSTLRAAISRATAAGMVIVMSAGNEGQADPSALALVATESGARGQIIVAGAHDTNKTISSFSNRAGQTASVYLTALGEEVRSFDENGTALIYSGTSFSAPFISGAVALIAQAFPNMTGAQIVQLLLESADDTGATGTDPVYGRGALNIGRAFQPRGGAWLAGSQVAIDLTGDSATLSPAMGDAAQSGMGAIILDGFDRAFAIDLSRSVRNAAPQSSLTGTLSRSNRGASLSAGGTTVAVSIADTPGGAAVRRLTLGPADAVRARTTAGMIASRIDSRTIVALGFGQGRDSLAGQLAGRADPAFLVARGSGDGLGFDRLDQSSAAIRHLIGRVGVTAGVESGEGLLHRPSLAHRDPYLRSRYSLLSIGADRRFGGLRLAGGLTRLQEERTLLGARFGSVFGTGGGNSWFADMSAGWSFGRGWRLGASARQGWSVPAAGGLLTERAAIRSNAFSFDVGKAGLLSRGDLFGFRISQPLRVSSGGLTVRLPVGYDYDSATASFADQRLNLAPEGRELALEASYSRMFFGGRIDTNLFWRQEPGHFAAASDDLGAALRWRTEF